MEASIILVDRPFSNEATASETKAAGNKRGHSAEVGGKSNKRQRVSANQLVTDDNARHCSGTRTQDQAEVSGQPELSECARDQSKDLVAMNEDENESAGTAGTAGTADAAHSSGPAQSSDAADAADTAETAEETEEDVCQQKVKTGKKILTLKGILNPIIKKGATHFIAASIFFEDLACH